MGRNGRAADANGHEREYEYFDVVIVGAGMSGIAAAYYLEHQLPHLK